MAPSSRCCSAAFARSSRFRGTGPSAGTKVRKGLAREGGREGGALPPCALRLARVRAENPGPSGEGPRTTSQPKGARNLLPRSPPSPVA